jgi:hypothetical protein
MMRWIGLDQDRDQRRAVVKVVMNIGSSLMPSSASQTRVLHTQP